MAHLAKPNLERASRAKEALAAYALAVYGSKDSEGDDTLIIDFLVDLQHYCDQVDVDCSYLFGEAMDHYLVEKEINESVLILEAVSKKSREVLQCGCNIMSSGGETAFTACPTHQTVLGEQASRLCLRGNNEDEDCAPCGCALIWHEDGAIFVPCDQHRDSYPAQDVV